MWICCGRYHPSPSILVSISATYQMAPLISSMWFTKRRISKDTLSPQQTWILNCHVLSLQEQYIISLCVGFSWGPSAPNCSPIVTFWSIKAIRLHRLCYVPTCFPQASRAPGTPSGATGEIGNDPTTAMWAPISLWPKSSKKMRDLAMWEVVLGWDFDEMNLPSKVGIAPISSSIEWKCQNGCCWFLNESSSM